MTVKAARARRGLNGMLVRCGIKYSGNGGGLHSKVEKETRHKERKPKGRQGERTEGADDRTKQIKGSPQIEEDTRKRNSWKKGYEETSALNRDAVAVRMLSRNDFQCGASRIPRSVPMLVSVLMSMYHTPPPRSGHNSSFFTISNTRLMTVTVSGKKTSGFHCKAFVKAPLPVRSRGFTTALLSRSRAIVSSKFLSPAHTKTPVGWGR